MADSYYPDYDRRRPPPPSDHDSYRPRYNDRGPPAPPADARNAMYHFRGNARDNHRPEDGNRPNHHFNFRSKPKVFERPLLRTRDNAQEERITGTGSQEKFRDIGNLTDSDEADMEDSEDEDARPAKRSKVGTDVEIPGDKPKWSNPDPYTALPAPSETTGKKLDFIKMIRKARNETVKNEPESNANDFISFGLGDNDNLQSSSTTDGPKSTSHATTTPINPGKRKRDQRSGGKPTLLGPRDRRYYSNGMILDNWSARDGPDATPWFQDTRESSASIALHKEILDFYNWVKPRDYEFAVRTEALNRIEAVLRRFEPGGQLKAFGSYAAGLYLPTGDMDLVYLTKDFRLGSNMMGSLSRNKLWKFRDWIEQQRIAAPGSIQCIPKAKVPIIKFVERISGLKIDLSFNNDTGVIAIDTFQKWRKQHPAMPILVSIIKQFLMIRGLNDVSVGGLGGFSSICLVTSVIQHMPATKVAPNLGEVLLEFFNLYGNHFDRQHIAIRMDPPGYMDKDSLPPYLFNTDQAGRLTIIDPNRPDNNISGGTSEIGLIMRTFSEAYEILQERLDDFHREPSQNFSFLAELVGGNFGAYDKQRTILYDLYYGQNGHAAPAVIPPPPPPVSQHIPPPPPPADSQAVKRSTSARKEDLTPAKSKPSAAVLRMPWEKPHLSKNQRRAARWKVLRPDLASKIKGTLTTDVAMNLGGYKDVETMADELTRLEIVYRAAHEE